MNFIIVLGSSDAEKRKARVARAVDYYNHLTEDVPAQFIYKRGINAFSAYDEIETNTETNIRIIFSGKGAFRDQHSPTEADDMYRLAIGMGIPENVCILEKESNNTHENIVNTLKLLKTYSWFKPTFYSLKPTFTICTSHFHAKRSLVVGKFILSEDGYVKIIHTNELIPQNVADHEAHILNAYIEKVVLPEQTTKY